MLSQCGDVTNGLDVVIFHFRDENEVEQVDGGEGFTDNTEIVVAASTVLIFC